jgi:hypothetical protein
MGTEALHAVPVTKVPGGCVVVFESYLWSSWYCVKLLHVPSRRYRFDSLWIFEWNIITGL